MMETTILLDESSLNRALQVRARQSRRNPEYRLDLEQSHETLSSQYHDSSEYLLDEGALNRALKSKAERRRSISASRGQPRNSNYRALPRRRSSRQNKTPNSMKKKGSSSSSREKIKKSRSYKSESSHTSSNYTGSVNPTVTTRSVNSNSDSLDATSNHSSMTAARQGRKPTSANKPSRRSKSEPRRKAKTVPFFHVSTSAYQRAPSPVPVSSSASSSAVSSAYPKEEPEKHTFLKQTIAPTSILQPVKNIVDPNADPLIEAMGGSDVVERIASRFYVIAKTTSELGAFMKGVHLHQLQEEFVTLGNMEMTDDMVQLSEIVQFHYHLIANGVDVHRVVGLWTDAYEAVWMASDMDDSRSLVGPSRAVFNLKAVANLYDNHQREKRWNRRMEDDEKRIEEIQEQRRRRKEIRREKQRQRRSKSIDSFFSPFRRKKSYE